MSSLVLILAVFFNGILGFQSPKDQILIYGRIIGKIPEKLEYTSPINGICNWWFTETVKPDSLGNFNIRISSGSPIFIKLRTSYKDEGTLIIEPGKKYNVLFDLNSQDNAFSVTDKSSNYQAAYNKLPNPSHIQVGAGEFMGNSDARAIKDTIARRKAGEIALFKTFLSKKNNFAGSFQYGKNRQGMLL